MRHRLRRLRPPVSRLLLRRALRAPTPSLPLASRGRKPDRIEEGSRPPLSARRATGPENPATPPRAALAGTGPMPLPECARRPTARAGRGRPGLDSGGGTDEGEGGRLSRLGPRRRREGDVRKGNGSLAACAPSCGPGRGRCTTARPGPRSTPHGATGAARSRRRLRSTREAAWTPPYGAGSSCITTATRSSTSMPGGTVT